MFDLSAIEEEWRARIERWAEPDCPNYWDPGPSPGLATRKRCAWEFVRRHPHYWDEWILFNEEESVTEIWVKQGWGVAGVPSPLQDHAPEFEIPHPYRSVVSLDKLEDSVTSNPIGPRGSAWVLLLPRQEVAIVIDATQPLKPQFEFWRRRVKRFQDEAGLQPSVSGRPRIHFNLLPTLWRLLDGHAAGATITEMADALALIDEEAVVDEKTVKNRLDRALQIMHSRLYLHILHSFEPHAVLPELDPLEDT